MKKECEFLKEPAAIQQCQRNISIYSNELLIVLNRSVVCNARWISSRTNETSSSETGLQGASRKTTKPSKKYRFQESL